MLRRLAAPLLVIAVSVIACCARGGSGEVVVYVSEDQVFSEPILKDFEKETGIHVRAVFDTEEAKSAGVTNRLLAERRNPQADVYWANEPIRAELLRQERLTEPYVSPAADGIPIAYKDPGGHWTGFSARARVLLVRKAMVEKPRSILALTDPRFRGRAVLANPLFGTTTAEVAALFTIKGNAWGQQFVEQLKTNQVKVSASNGESADAVASGAAEFSLVDSDDGVSRMRQGQPVEMVVPDQGADDLGVYLVPNAVLLVHGAPHAEAGKKLIDYLLSPATERKLAAADCAQLPLRAGVAPPPELPPLAHLKLMTTDHARVAAKMKELQPWLTRWAGM